MPKISVILPAYNAEKYLGEAIDSILNQSFQDFEFLIFNDGSTDATKEIIDGYKDHRIITYHSDVNKGYVHWLNEGIKQAKGKYIARMDADDVSLPERFQLQYDYMETHPEIGVCGSQIEIIGSGDLVKKPLTDNDIRWWFFIGNPIAHPVVMLRKEVLEKHQLLYNLTLKPAEDYDMWWRMAHKTQLHNLPDVLLQYRYHAQQESTANVGIQTKHFLNGLESFLRSIDVSVNQYNLAWFEKLFNSSLEANSKAFLKIDAFFESLSDSPKAILFFGKNSIQLKKQWLLSRYIQNIQNYDRNLISFMLRKGNLKSIQLSKVGTVSFIIKSLLNWKTRQ